MAKQLCPFLRLALLASFAIAPITAVDTKQCDADQATSCGSEAGHNEFTRYEKFEDIPQDIVERAHLRELGSHREADAEVEVLNYMISSEDFYERHVAHHKPVVLKNVAKHWPATKLWTDEYLKENYGDVALNVETTGDARSPIPPGGTVREFLDVYKTSKVRIAGEMPPGMRKDTVMPQCVRCNIISNRIFALHFRMSHSAMSSRLHIHTDNSLLTAVQGSMDVVLVSPKYSRDVYADEAPVLGVSEVNVSAVDLEKFPRVSNIHYSTAHLERGDSIYLPKMWWYWIHSPAIRQQAVLMKWKSAPVADARHISSLKRSNGEMVSASVVPSYSKWLEEYAVLMESEENKRVDMQVACHNRVLLMSDTPFETTMDDWRDDLTGGGTRTGEPIEGVDEEAIRMGSTRSANAILRDDGDSDDDEAQMYSQAGDTVLNRLCYFDWKNPGSPCRSLFCAGDVDTAGIAYGGGDSGHHCSDGALLEEEGNELLKAACCLRFTLDYCDTFEDRGCIIELPGLLNKLTPANITFLESLQFSARALSGTSP